MVRATDKDRLQRLDRLTARLKADEPLTIETIAVEFGISCRSVARDLQVLRERGLPVETERGRGGGVRLHWSWGIGRIALSYREAVDLLVSLAIAQQMKSPILMANLEPIHRKLMASFSPEQRRKIRHLRSRILIGQSASPFILTGYDHPSEKVVEVLHQTFLMMKAALIIYRNEAGRRTSRMVEPHYLLLSYPVWYALCWDRLREAVRTFRCDRMLSIQATDESFRPRDRALFLKAIEGVELVENI